MDEDIQQSKNKDIQSPKHTKESSTKEHQSLSPNKDQPESSKAHKTDASDSESSSCFESLKRYDNCMPITERKLHEEAVVSYANLRAVIEGYYKDNVDHKDRTNKIVKETTKTIDNISKEGVDEITKLLKALNEVSKTLEADSALKEEMRKMVESHNTISGNHSSLTRLLSNARLPEILTKMDPHSSEVGLITTCSCSNDKDILSIKIQESRKLNHKDKVFRKQDLPLRFQVYQGRLLASFQDDAKYEHGGQDTRLQGGEFREASSCMAKPPSYTKGVPMQIVNTIKKREDAGIETTEEEPARASRAIPISTVILISKPNPEIRLIKFSSRPPLTDTTIKFPVSKPETKIIGSSSSLMIDITPPEQPERPPMAPKADRGKGIATDDT
nr:hypothetical protein [Tanacetum cinerariifolium]